MLHNVYFRKANDKTKSNIKTGLWLGCLTPLSIIFQSYRGRSVLLVEETGVLGENR
jgi:hypothetical protein